jgi:two-component system response regulator FixJ
MTMPSVFVVEDDFAVRDSLVLLLRSEGMRARGFANGEEFLANLPNDPVACVVTDLRMPGADGFEVVRKLIELRGDAWPIIVITGHADVSSAVELMKAGVTDFIEKPFEPHRLVETLKGCIRRVQEVGADMERRADIDRRLAHLTARERQVFDALAAGLSNKEIAAQLDISPRTVEIFRAKVMSKMEAANLSALVRMSLGLT